MKCLVLWCLTVPLCGLEVRVLLWRANGCGFIAKLALLCFLPQSCMLLLQQNIVLGSGRDFGSNSNGGLRELVSTHLGICWQENNLGPLPTLVGLPYFRVPWSSFRKSTETSCHPTMHAWSAKHVISVPPQKMIGRDRELRWWLALFCCLLGKPGKAGWTNHHILQLPSDAWGRRLGCLSPTRNQVSHLHEGPSFPSQQGAFAYWTTVFSTGLCLFSGILFSLGWLQDV